MAGHLSPEGLVEVLNDTRAGARSRNTEHTAAILEAVVPCLPRAMLREGLLTVLDIPNKFHRKRSLRMLTDRLQREGQYPGELQQIWGRLANRERLDTHYDLGSLLALLLRSRAQASIVQCVEAIQDVARWWS
jgi:hypothetical protein